MRALGVVLNNKLAAPFAPARWGHHRGLSMRISRLLASCIATPIFLVPLLGEAQGIRVVYAEQYRPYSWEEGVGATGLEVELAEELFRRRLGLEIKHQVLPWARAQAEVASGNADFFFASATPERQQFSLAVGEALIQWHASAFVRKSDVDTLTPRALGIDMLCNEKTGVVRGNSWAKRHLSCASLTTSTSPQTLIRMLLMKRTDVIVDDGLVVRDLARQMKVEQDLHEIPIHEGAASIQLRIGHKSKYQDLIPKLTNAMTAMRADRTLQRIVSRYASPQMP